LQELIKNLGRSVTITLMDSVLTNVSRLSSDGWPHFCHCLPDNPTFFGIEFIKQTTLNPAHPHIRKYYFGSLKITSDFYTKSRFFV
jgi:hypothetical protein